MPNYCAIVGCSNYEGKACPVKLYKVPQIRKNEGPAVMELTERRQRAWLRAIYRKDITVKTLKPHHKVCAEHFISGKPSYHMNDTDPDWAPTLKLGIPNPRTRADIHLRRMRREKHKMEVSAANSHLTLAESNGIKGQNSLSELDIKFKNPKVTFSSNPMHPGRILKGDSKYIHDASNECMYEVRNCWALEAQSNPSTISSNKIKKVHEYTVESPLITNTTVKDEIKEVNEMKEEKACTFKTVLWPCVAKDDEKKEGIDCKEENECTLEGLPETFTFVIGKEKDHMYIKQTENCLYDCVKLIPAKIMSRHTGHDLTQKVIPLSVSSDYSVVKDRMFCLFCPYSNVTIKKMKRHIVMLHPTAPTIVSNNSGKAAIKFSDIIFLCIKETCPHCTVECNVYEEHLITCCPAHQILSLDRKKRMESTLNFLLDFHKERSLKPASGFLDFVLSFSKTYESDNLVKSPSFSNMDCLEICSEGNSLLKQNVKTEKIHTDDIFPVNIVPNINNQHGLHSEIS